MPFRVKEEAPLYLFDRSFSALCPQLASDYTEPPYFTPSAPHG